METFQEGKKWQSRCSSLTFPAKPASQAVVLPNCQTLLPLYPRIILTDSAIAEQFISPRRHSHIAFFIMTNIIIIRLKLPCTKYNLLHLLAPFTFLKAWQQKGKARRKALFSTSTSTSSSLSHILSFPIYTFIMTEKTKAFCMCSRSLDDESADK